MAYTLQTADFQHLQCRDLLPIEVPTVEDSPVTTTNLYLEMLHFVNPTTSDAIITVKDKQGTPLAVAVAPTFAKEDWLREFKGRKCPGGISWVSSVAGVIGYLRGRW